MVLKILLTVALLASTRDRLDPWYAGFNEKYFNNELPKNVLITHDLKDDRFEAYTEQYKSGFFHINFNPKYNQASRAERLTLLHEQCHIRQMSADDTEFDDHGPKWQNCMHDLAHKGAFDELW